MQVVTWGLHCHIKVGDDDDYYYNHLLSTELGQADIVDCCIALYLSGGGEGPARPTGSLQYRVSAVLMEVMEVMEVAESV